MLGNRFLPSLVLSFVAFFALAADAQVNTRLLRGKQARQAEYPAYLAPSRLPDHEVQKWLASSESLKVMIEKDGWYRIEASELSSFGFDSLGDPSRIRLYADGIEQAIRIDQGGAIEFYGKGRETAWTKLRTYWLIKGSPGGKRISSYGGGAFDESAQEASFEHILLKEEKNFRTTVFIDPAHDGFYAAIISPAPVYQVVWMEGFAAESVLIEIAMRGLTMVQDHVVKVKLNGREIGIISSFYRDRALKTFTVGRSFFREGKNTIELSSSGSSDVSVLEYVKARYQKRVEAIDGGISFFAEAGRKVKALGFNDGRLRVADISDPDSVKEIEAEPFENLSGEFEFSLAPAEQGRLIRAERRVSAKPLAIERNIPQSLSAQQNMAEYIAIAPTKFFNSLAPLKSLRQAEGLSAKIIDIQDIYDEFSFGEKDPRAIRSFMEAARNWRVKPRYLLLAGDSSIDPKGYLPGAAEDIIPSVTLVGIYGESASDDWFSDFDGDAVADIPTGRLSVKNAAELSTVVGKIIDYSRRPEGDTRAKGALMVSDSFIYYNFQAMSEDVRTSMPANINSLSINRNDGAADAVRANILSSINQGYGIVNFLGHGSYGVWTSAQLLRAADGPALANGSNTSIFVMLACLNGGFAESNESLAESLQKASNGGAVAVWASSGETFAFGQVEMSKAFYQKIFSEPGIRLGDAIQHSKHSMADMDIRRFAILFGDPAMRVKS